MNQRKIASKKSAFRRTLLWGALIVSPVAIVAVALMAFLHSSVAELTAKARMAISEGNGESAKAMLIKAVGSDDANETAFAMLADVYESENSLEVSAYFREKTMNLNPLDFEAEKKFFDTLSTARMDAYLIFKYENFPAARIPSPHTEYRAARAYLRVDNPVCATKICQKLSVSAPMLAEIIEGYLALSIFDFKVAEAAFSRVEKNASSPEIANEARIGKASALQMAGDIEGAANEIEKIKNPSREISGDIAEIQSAIAVRKGDLKTALLRKREALNVRTSDINMFLECAELAEAAHDSTTIEELKAGIPVRSRTAATINYYLNALLESVKEDYGEVLKNLRFCGALANRNVAQIIKFRAACALDDVKTAIESASPFLSQNISAEMRHKVSVQLARLLKSETARAGSERDRLSNILKALAPTDVETMALIAEADIARGRFAEALSAAKKIRARSPQNIEADRIEIAALYGLKMYSNGLERTGAMLERNPDDFFAAAFSAKMSAAAGDKKSALSKYASAAKCADASPTFCAEARDYIFAEGSANDKAHIAKILSTKKNANISVLGAISESAIMFESGKAKEAIMYLSEAFRKNSSDEKLAVALSGMQYSCGDSQAARKTLDSALSRGSTSPIVKIRLASLLSESGSRTAAERGIKLVENCGAAAQTPLANFIISRCRLALGDEIGAIESANAAASAAPDDPYIADFLARLLAKRGRFEEAFRTILYNQTLVSESAEILDEYFVESLKHAPSAAYKKALAKELLNKIPTSSAAAKALSEAELELKKTHE